MYSVWSKFSARIHVNSVGSFTPIYLNCFYQFLSWMYTDYFHVSLFPTCLPLKKKTHCRSP